jgi:hypothetical protein
MKAPTFAPVYVLLFPILSEIAQEYGYALAVHGSVQTDFDLIAIPWVLGAKSPEELIQAIAKHLKVLEGSFGTGIDGGDIGDKPHGRIAWKLQLGGMASVDLSVMPRILNREEHNE